MKKARELDANIERAIERAADHGDNRSDPFTRDRLRCHYRMGIWDPSEAKASDAK